MNGLTRRRFLQLSCVGLLPGCSHSSSSPCRVEIWNFTGRWLNGTFNFSNGFREYGVGGPLSNPDYDAYSELISGSYFSFDCVDVFSNESLRLSGHIAELVSSKSRPMCRIILNSDKSVASAWYSAPSFSRYRELVFEYSQQHKLVPLVWLCRLAGTRSFLWCRQRPVPFGFSTADTRAHRPTSDQAIEPLAIHSLDASNQMKICFWSGIAEENTPQWNTEIDLRSFTNINTSSGLALETESSGTFRIYRFPVSSNWPNKNGNTIPNWKSLNADLVYEGVAEQKPTFAAYNIVKGIPAWMPDLRFSNEL